MNRNSEFELVDVQHQQTHSLAGPLGLLPERLQMRIEARAIAQGLLPLKDGSNTARNQVENGDFLDLVDRRTVTLLLRRISNPGEKVRQRRLHRNDST